MQAGVFSVSPAYSYKTGLLFERQTREYMITWLMEEPDGFGGRHLFSTAKIEQNGVQWNSERVILRREPF